MVPVATERMGCKTRLLTGRLPQQSVVDGAALFQFTSSGQLFATVEFRLLTAPYLNFTVCNRRGSAAARLQVRTANAAVT
jgi:hypothetical protein